MRVTEKAPPHLESVEVLIDVYARHGEGAATYVLRNPTAEDEDLQIFFEPGRNDASSTEVWVDGIPVETSWETIGCSYIPNEPYVQADVFGVQIPALSDVQIDITWTCKSTFGGRQDVSYLIISTDAWAEPITSVSVTFDVHCAGYESAVDEFEGDTSLNDEGYPTFTLQEQDVSGPAREVEVQGAYIADDDEGLIIGGCFISTARPLMIP
jgi:hypothetical protein